VFELAKERQDLRLNQQQINGSAESYDFVS